MARRPATHEANKSQLMTLDPELGLLAAVVMQALHDARSRRPDIRAEARQFLENAEALTWWGEVLGVGEALHQHVQTVLREGP